MAFPIIGAVAIGTSIVSGILGSRARRSAERRRAEALEENALVRLASTTSGLAAREQEELANAAQARRLGRRQSAVLEARAVAAGAAAGVGSAEQAQDVQLGLSEFLGSVEENLARTRAQLARGRRGAQREFESARRAARAGVAGPGADFLDFLNIGIGAVQAFGALPRSRNTFQGGGSGEPDIIGTSQGGGRA